MQSGLLRVDELSRKRYAQQFQKIIAAARADEIITDKVVITGNPVEVILDQTKHRKSVLSGVPCGKTTLICEVATLFTSSMIFSFPGLWPCYQSAMTDIG